jgi:copper(I)-binding protein
MFSSAPAFIPSCRQSAASNSRQHTMTITSYGRIVTTTAMLFLFALFFAARAQADTVWAGDISISNVSGLPTPKGADIAHISLVISNTGEEDDVLIGADVSPQIAAAAGFDPLSLRVYRGANLRRSQPLFLSSGQTRVLGFDDVHLVLYGIQGPFHRGLKVPVRLTFQNAGAVDMIVHVGGDISSTVAFSGDREQPFLLRIRDQDAPRAFLREPSAGSEFRCEDGSKLVLSFTDAGHTINALVWLRGETYRLPHLPPEPGPVQIVWSDGESSLTWSPGVRLMWMTGDTHLMCGRGGHQH